MSIEMTRSCAADLTARINASSADLAGMLKRAHDEKAWQALGYPDWKSYVRAELKFSEQRSFQLLDFAVIRGELADSTIVESKNLPSAETVTRELKKADPADRPAVYSRAVEAAGGQRPTAKQVREAAVEMQHPIKQAEGKVIKSAIELTAELCAIIHELGKCPDRNVVHIEIPRILSIYIADLTQCEIDMLDGDGKINDAVFKVLHIVNELREALK